MLVTSHDATIHESYRQLAGVRRNLTAAQQHLTLWTSEGTAADLLAAQRAESALAAARTGKESAVGELLAIQPEVARDLTRNNAAIERVEQRLSRGIVDSKTHSGISDAITGADAALERFRPIYTEVESAYRTSSNRLVAGLILGLAGVAGLGVLMVTRD